MTNEATLKALAEALKQWWLNDDDGVSLRDTARLEFDYRDAADAILAHLPTSQAERDGEALEDIRRHVHTTLDCFCTGWHDDTEAAFMTGKHVERVIAALGGPTDE